MNSRSRNNRKRRIPGVTRVIIVLFLTIPSKGSLARGRFESNQLGLILILAWGIGKERECVKAQGDFASYCTSVNNVL